MGNTPTKEVRSTTFGRDFVPSNVNKKKKDKFKKKEDHLLNLLVKHEENVDGGFLAPYGNYNYSLTYKSSIVKTLILERKLSPFYTPLEEFNPNWTDDELLDKLWKLNLHAEITVEDFENMEEDEEEDPDDHKIYQSMNSIKRRENKQFKKNFKKKMIVMQNEENTRFQKEKRVQRSGIKTYPYLPSDDLLLSLYRDAEECPICFLYFPKNLNVSRCCDQPICTECFVQLKRLDPHPPHDEDAAPDIDNDINNNADSTKQQDLISEPVKCPFCAMSDFGVTYKPPPFKIGQGGGIPLSDYKSSANTASSTHSGSTVTRKRRDSLLPNAPGVVTIDQIRPDWEQRLISARAKLARRSAAATALHASSLIVADRSSFSNEDTTSARHASSTPTISTRKSSTSRMANVTQLSLEERMIEEALRLSLIDEEERQLKEKEKDREKLKKTKQKS